MDDCVRVDGVRWIDLMQALQEEAATRTSLTHDCGDVLRRRRDRAGIELREERHDVHQGGAPVRQAEGVHYPRAGPVPRSPSST